MLRFDLAETVAGVAELYEPVADESGLELKVEIAGPLPMHGVRELFGQALANLLDNAIKYSAPETPGERRELDLRASRVGDRLRLVVADRGPGIGGGGSPRACWSVSCGLEASRTRPGFGLGLSLVAAVVRLHGGTLSLEGNDPGLRVVIDLPLDLSDEAEAA